MNLTHALFFLVTLLKFSQSITNNKTSVPLKKITNDCDSIEASESNYLYIGLSQIKDSGNGLLTAIDIYKDEVISLFKGEILTDSIALLRSGKGKDKYFIKMVDGRILDSMNVKCFAKYANDATGFSISDFKNNSKIALNERNEVCLIATRNIKKGEEIFCSYGKEYWKKHGFLLLVRACSSYPN